MRTLRDEMLRLQGALRTGVIGEDEYEQALAERSGRTISQTGRLLPKRGWVGTEVNGERATMASQSVQRGHSRSVKLDKAKSAPEVRARDMLIKAGAYPVRVVKGGPSGATIAERMVAVSTAE